MPNGRCVVHGGKSPGAPLTAGGRHSKYLPQRLAARYEEALKDAELLSVQADIALLDARLGEVLSRLDTSETSEAWALALKLYREAHDPDPKKRLGADTALGQVLEKGLADVAAWSEIRDIIEDRRKCAETETKRLAQMDQFITAKQANVLVAAIVKLVSENVSDVDSRARIATGLVELVCAAHQPSIN